MSRMFAMVVASTQYLVPSKSRLRSVLGTRYWVLFRHRFPVRHELLLRLLDYIGQLRLQGVIENFLLHDRAQQAALGCIDVFIKLFLEVADLIYWKVIEESSSTGKDDQNLFR